MSDETQFAGFAELLYGELNLMFQDLASERAHEDYETADKTAQKIRDYLACRAYDLVRHATQCLVDSDLGEESLDKSMAYVTDLLIWPEETDGKG